LFVYHVGYCIKHPRRRMPVFGDLDVERRDPISTPERITDVKREIARRQTQLDALPNIEWISILQLFELSSRP
jgi:hypothetical protein